MRRNVISSPLLDLKGRSDLAREEQAARSGALLCFASFAFIHERRPSPYKDTDGARLDGATSRQLVQNNDHWRTAAGTVRREGSARPTRPRNSNNVAPRPAPVPLDKDNPHGASWMCAAIYSAASSSRRNFTRLMLGAGFPKPDTTATCSYRPPVVGADSLLDRKISDDKKAPTLHVSAAELLTSPSLYEMFWRTLLRCVSIACQRAKALA